MGVFVSSLPTDEILFEIHLTSDHSETSLDLGARKCICRYHLSKKASIRFVQIELTFNYTE